MTEKSCNMDSIGSHYLNIHILEFLNVNVHLKAKYDALNPILIIDC